MKKAILVLLCLSFTLVVFAGCNSIPEHRKLEAVYGEYQNLEYVVENKIDENTIEKGVCNIIIERVKGQTITLGKNSYENSSGVLVTIDFKMENGDTKLSQVFSTTQMKSKYSYSNANIDGKKTEIYGTYEKKSYIYEGTNAGKEIKEKIKYKEFNSSPYFDNALLYYVFACAKLENSTLGFNINVPAWEENQLKTIAVKFNAKNKRTVEFGTEIECYEINFASNDKLLGLGKFNKCFYSVEPLGNENTKYAKQLVEIEEGNISYKLKSINYTK